MGRSRIIVELIKDEITVIQAINLLKLLLQDIENEKINKWLDCEINGYNDNDIVPDYRIVSCSVKGNVLSGYTMVSNMNIPIKDEFKDLLSKVEIKHGINEIIQYAKAEEEVENHTLKLEIPLDYIQSMSLVNGQIIHVSRLLSVYAFTNIINSLKPIILNILIELEKIYGNLDEYYIDLKDPEKTEYATNVIINIIDNSTKIGNHNKIENSNVGDGNENRN